MKSSLLLHELLKTTIIFVDCCHNSLNEPACALLNFKLSVKFPSTELKAFECAVLRNSHLTFTPLIRTVQENPQSVNNK